MKKLDLFKIGVEELSSNKLRTFLTMLGIVFGVGSVIAMLSIGEGARVETMEQIDLLGSNNIIIRKIEVNREKSTNNSFSPGLTTDDLVSISKICPNIISITPQINLKDNITFLSKSVECNIVSTTENYANTFNSKLLNGNFFNKYHLQNNSNVCVLGSEIKSRLFKYKNPIGKEIKIGDLCFKVIGVFASKNNITSNSSNTSFRNFNLDIYIPITTMKFKMQKRVMYSRGNRMSWDGMGAVANAIDRKSIDQLTIKVSDESKIVDVAEIIDRILKRRHYSVEDYSIIIPEEIMAQKQKTQQIFNIVMGAIAGISLLVGGIGIMNIMLANIMERTKEIGIRRAVGATRKNVLNQFIFEALIISFVGGILGILTGYLLTSAISNYAEWRTIITPFSVVLAFLVSIAVGLIFGSYPAKKAAEKDPIDSLRYE